MKPAVTVGICARNSVSTLQNTIDSVVSQDFPHELMEVIFVDDGSTDETSHLISTNIPTMDIPVKFFHHKWKGLGASRNVVIKNAEGNYIIWVDADMIFSSNFVMRLVEFMNDNPKVGIAKGKQILEPGSNLLSTLESCSRAVGRMVNYQSNKALMKSLGTGGSIYRMEALHQTNGFDEGLRGYGEDWDLEMRIKKLGWSLNVVNTQFSDYERYNVTWKSLWQRYWRRGYYSHYFLHKNKGALKLSRMFPVVSFFTGFTHALKLYTLTRRTSVFLLPLEYYFKMSAWYMGFIDSHLNLYQPQ